MAASLLVDKKIISAVQQGSLIIEDPGKRKLIDPDTGKPARDAGLDAHGYILHARRLYSWRKSSGDNGKWINLKEKNKFILYPGELIIIETYEHLTFSPKICGTIHSLARLTLLGYSHISTTVHPGWGQGEGTQPLRIAISNQGRLKLEIKDKDPIARMLLYQSDVSAEISAPRPDEVFHRSDVAISKHKKAAAFQNRIWRLTFLIFITAMIVVAQPLFTGGATVSEMLKTGVMALIGLWAAYLFKTMPDL